MSQLRKLAMFIFPLIAFPLFTEAQGNETAGLAPCAVSCLNNAYAYSGCSEADTYSGIACGCFDPKFQQVIGPCIMKNCDEADSEQLLQDATQLCATVGGTPVDNAAAISSLSDEPGAAALYTSFEADGLASSRLAIASSQGVANSLQIENGIAATATPTGSTANAIVTPTGIGNLSGSMPARTGTANIAAFTGGVSGRKEMRVTALGAIAVVISGGLLL